jgi:hypothetical protein
MPGSSFCSTKRSLADALNEGFRSGQLRTVRHAAVINGINSVEFMMNSGLKFLVMGQDLAMVY